MTREEFQKLLPGLVKEYKPAPDVIDHIDRLNVLMLVGPSGAGKSTLINALPYRYVPVDNTRPARPGEAEGVDFFFRTDFEQIVREIKAGRFVQLAVDSGGDFKATRASSYPESGTVSMAIVADVVPIIRSLGFAKTTTAFITPPNYDEWMRRLNQHKLEDEALARRLAEAKRSFDFALNDQSTHFILSDNVPAATEQLMNLIDGQVDEARELSAQIIAEQIAHKLNKES